MGMKNLHPNIRHVIRGTLHATIATLVLVLGLALVVWITGLGGVTLDILTQIAKVLGIFYGVSVALRRIDNRGWLFGGIVAVIQTVLIYFLFSIFGASFSITVGLLTELLFATVVGVISALLLRGGRKFA